MIGYAAFRRRASAAPAEAELGMLDVSANALAVLILATMLVISAAAPPILRGEVRSDAHPDLFYPSPIDAVLAPHSRYVIVLLEGMVELDLDAFAEQLALGEVTARTAQGSLTLVTDRRMYRDLNDYRATVTLDWPALATSASALPLDTEGVEAEASFAAGAFDRRGVATTYLVAAEAVSEFAPLYWTLRDKQAPIRWSTVPVGRNVVFQRNVQDFERRSRQWQ